VDKFIRDCEANMRRINTHRITNEKIPVLKNHVPEQDKEIKK